MKLSFLFLSMSVLLLNSCQNMPWNKDTTASDPYAAGGGAGYPATNPGTPGYAAPTYDVSGEQAQVYPATGAAPAATAPPTKYSAPPATKTQKPNAKSQPTPVVSGGSGRTYVVQKGDTLSKISKAKGTTVAKMMKANGLSSDVIRVGQTLKY